MFFDRRNCNLLDKSCESWLTENEADKAKKQTNKRQAAMLSRAGHQRIWFILFHLQQGIHNLQQQFGRSRKKCKIFIALLCFQLWVTDCKYYPNCMMKIN